MRQLADTFCVPGLGDASVRSRTGPTIRVRRSPAPDRHAATDYLQQQSIILAMITGRVLVAGGFR